MNPFVPSATYMAVLALLPQLNLVELNRLKLQDIHREQLDRQGRVPYPEDEHAKVGKHAVHKVAN